MGQLSIFANTMPNALKIVIKKYWLSSLFLKLLVLKVKFKNSGEIVITLNKIYNTFNKNVTF